jgi:S-adenosylmethionine/arginine decarboxylase-like enzyme
MVPEGTHLLMDFYDAPDPGDESLPILRRMAALAGCDILNEIEHIFDGLGGRTALLLLSQSHASIHTWPEYRYVSVDFYSCRKLAESEVELLTSYAKVAFRSGRELVRSVSRGNDL